jgi:chitinase
MRGITLTSPTSGSGHSRIWRKFILLFASALMLGFLTPLAASAAPGQLLVRDKTTVEDAGTVSVRIVLAQRVNHKVSVSYRTKDGTAVAGADYTATTGRVTFPKGAKARNVVIPILQDSVVEGNETFKVRLFDPARASILDRTGIVTIVDDDLAPPYVPPTMSVADATAVEGSPLSFVVSLSKAAEGAVTFDYATSDDTAKAPGDYTAVTAGKGTIAAGATSTTITVQTTQDTTPESTEAMKLTLTNPSGATISDGQAVGTITDNDPVTLPTVSVGDAHATEGSPLVFTVTLSAKSAVPVQVGWKTSDNAPGDTAKTPEDYVAEHNSNLVIPAGQLSATFDVATVNDHVDETNEVFKVTLYSPVNATIGDGTGEGMIVDNDGPSISVGSDQTTTEGGNLVFTISLSKASVQDVKVDYKTSDDTAKAPGDYGAVSGTVTIPAGHLVEQVTVKTVDDAVAEAKEHFEFTLSNPVNATIGDGHADGIILDNDGLPTLSVGDAHATEGSPIVFTVTLSAKSAVPVQVGWKTSDNATGDTAKTPADYVAEHNSNLVIPAGQLSATFDVATVDDALDEVDEVFKVTLYSPIGATIGDGTGEGMIVDNDNPPTLSVGDAHATEGSPIVFTVTLSALSGKDVQVGWKTSDNATGDTAKTPADYVAEHNSNLVIPAGHLTATFDVATVQDTTDEFDEVFKVTLYSPVNATIADGTGEGKIIDDDAAPLVYIAGTADVTEGHTAQLDVTLSAKSEKPITVLYSTRDDSATHVHDFTAVTNKTLTFAPGVTLQKADVLTLMGDGVEPDEWFYVDISAPTNATLSAHTTGTVRILANHT